MSRTAGRAAHFLVAKNVTLRRETIVIALALLVLAAALPFAIFETVEKGRVYPFSRQFIEELPQRFTGPGRFRFILQPMIAIFLGIRGGLADARSGNPPFVLGLLFYGERRRELLRSAAAAIAFCSPWGSSWRSCFNWCSIEQCIQAEPLWLGRFSFASLTHSPGH